MSKVFHVCSRSRVLTSRPCSAISSCMEGCFMSLMNSCLSSVPLSSRSALSNWSQRKPAKPFTRASWSVASSLCLVFVLDNIVSDATAVSKLRSVHETKVMKATKKNRHRTLVFIRGAAMFAQLSTVVSWNSVNSDVGMLRNRDCACSEALDPALASSRPFGPTMRVKAMLSTKQSMTMLARIHAKVLDMRPSRATKSLSLRFIRTRRYMRKSRVRVMNLTWLDWTAAKPIEQQTTKSRRPTARTAMS
mmetsp:Transcript_129325/g.361998  ORF Transcript_129325/g.361998 Transcript_129325/m.361998 type:complete len:248 (+) Transcript_129325:251-994(+)